MITSFFRCQQERNNHLLGVSVHLGLEGVVSLRDALADCIHNIVSYAEPKEGTNPYSLYLLTSVVNELTEDIEKKMTEKGGEQ